MTNQDSGSFLKLTADIVAAHVANNGVSPNELPMLITSVYGSLSSLGSPIVEPVVKQEPAISVRSSIKRDYIVCLEDGAKLKMLKRYLRTNFDMSPEDYRAKWNLPRDYPMVAPAYAETRRALAIQIGLGRKKVIESTEGAVEAVKTGGKKLGIVAAKAAAAAHLTGIAHAKKRGRPKKASDVVDIKLS